MRMKSDKRELDKIFKRRDRYEIPDYQRDKVWDTARKQALIDSILRGWRLPKFYFVASGSQPASYEVVDGQQRLAAIFEFLSNELELADPTASEFGGKIYSELPDDVSDRVDDFEIDYDEIEDASDSDLGEFFQRLQSGIVLNSSERLNAISSKLRSFCKQMASHEFFKNKVNFQDKRYAYFDVMAKVATLEVEGIESGLRFEDVKQVFETQKNFSDKSQRALRIRLALDFLNASFPDKSKAFRGRAITQSFISMIARLHATGALKDKEKTVVSFANTFVSELASEIEKGHGATDTDYIAFQKSINANVKAGPSLRHQILLRKFFQYDPSLLDNVGTEAVGANFSGEIRNVGADVRNIVGEINSLFASKYGHDLFKATNKTAIAQAGISDPVESFDEYKQFIERLYFLFWEGPGSKLKGREPQSFKDINVLRTEDRHDVDHGKSGAVKRKKLQHSTTFEKYAGVTSPLILSPKQFPLMQISLLKKLRTDLKSLFEGVTAGAFDVE